MKAWKYHHGEWTEVEDPLVWNEDEEWETVLKRAGYLPSPLMTYGQEFASQADLYQKEDYGPPYLIAFNLSDRIEHVYIDDTPSLMQWLRDYAPLFALDKMDYVYDEVLMLLRKAFRAWHGHDYERICPTCDPLEYKKAEEYRHRRAEKGKQA